MTTIPSPLLERPARPPEMTVGREMERFEASYWEPRNSEDIGKIEVVIRPENPHTITWPELELEGKDVPSTVQFFSDKGYPRIFDYCGISCSVQGKYPAPSLYETSVPHPQRFISRLGNLCAQAGCEPTPFTLYDGNLYSAKKFAQTLVDGGGILLSTKPGGDRVAHDVLLHGMVWALMSPEVIELARQSAADALERNQLEKFMNSCDGYMSVPGVGDSLKRALHHDADSRASAVAWKDVETAIAYGLRLPTPQLEVARYIRKHCDSLYQAAVSLGATAA